MSTYLPVWVEYGVCSVVFLAHVFDSVKLGNFEVWSATPSYDDLVLSLMLSSLRDVVANVSLGGSLRFGWYEGSSPLVDNVHVSSVVESNIFPSYDRSDT